MIPKNVLHDFVDGKIAVRTGQRFAREFLEACEDFGLMWRSGRGLTDFIPREYGDDLCFAYEYGYGVSYGDTYSMDHCGWRVVNIEGEPEGFDEGDMTSFESIGVQSVLDAKSKADTVSTFAKICNACSSAGFRDARGCDNCAVAKVNQLKMQVFALDDFTGAVMRQLKTPDMAESVMRVMAMERKCNHDEV